MNGILALPEHDADVEFLKPDEREEQLGGSPLLCPPRHSGIGLAGTDLALVHDTEGQIEDFDLLLFDDDFGFFPTYEATLKPPN